MKQQKNDKIIIYQAKSGAIELRRDIKKETIWATQAQMAKIFCVNPQAVTKHLKNIYQDKELNKKSTCSKMEQVQIEGKRTIKRSVEAYNLDAIISVGYRISSRTGTKFRQWATKTLRQYIIKGYAINKHRIAANYDQFLAAVKNLKYLLPAGSKIDNAGVLELVSAFADTWLSLSAYDQDTLVATGTSKKSVSITAEQLAAALKVFKTELFKKKKSSELFGQAMRRDAVGEIVGNVMQSFDGKALYSTVEERAAHLLYFIVKNHPFIDGNKRNGAYAFVWFLKKAGLLDVSKITPAALTALTLLIAESDPKQKEKMIRVILQLLKK